VAPGSGQGGYSNLGLFVTFVTVRSLATNPIHGPISLTNPFTFAGRVAAIPRPFFCLLANREWRMRQCQRTHQAGWVWTIRYRNQ
jgi:hypothetical protein